jgi:hypothetical protein
MYARYSPGITRWRVAFMWYLAALIVPLVIVAIAILSGATSRPFAGHTPADAMVPAVVLLPGLLKSSAGGASVSRRRWLMVDQGYGQP